MNSKREVARWVSRQLKLQRQRRTMRAVPGDPEVFFREFLGFQPFQYQADFVKGVTSNQFAAARWCRQSGKSFIIAAFLLWYALGGRGRQIGVVGPSFRQSKLVIRRISGFTRKAPVRPHIAGVLRTKVECLNGSVIEAFPNNPDTIRGPTLDLVYVDELNFCVDDEELYDAVLFTLGTTNGKFIATSTPWNQDSVFYRIWHDEDYADFHRSHVAWKDALEPNGPLKPGILEKIRKQFARDPFRWQREMEAEWAEDEDTYFSQALIQSCENPTLEYWKEEDLINAANRL